MRYKCPSCFIRWADHNDLDPFDKCHAQLCGKCGLGMDRSELIAWQMTQIDAMKTKDALKALSYAYVHLKESIDDLRSRE